MSSRDSNRLNLSCAIVPMDLAESTVSSFLRHQSNSSSVSIANCVGFICVAYHKSDVHVGVEREREGEGREKGRGERRRR